MPLLERARDTVHALTLTGLRPDDDDATVASANLDSHTEDVFVFSTALTSPTRHWSATATRGS